MQGCKVTAVDPNRTMQPYAEKNATTHELEGFEAVVGMAEQLPFQDSSFDRAVCTLVHPPSTRGIPLLSNHVCSTLLVL